QTITPPIVRAQPSGISSPKTILSQVSATEVGSAEVDSSHVSLTEIGFTQVDSAHHNTAEIGSLQIGFTGRDIGEERSPRESPPYVCFPQVCSPQVGMFEDGTGHIGPHETSFTEHSFAQVAPLETRSTQIGPKEVG